MLLIDNEGNYPRHLGDLLLAHPNYSEGNELPSGWKLVIETAPPEVSETQIYVEVFPKEINGEYFQAWEIKELTEKEILERRQNAIRNLKKIGYSDSEIELLLG